MRRQGIKIILLIANILFCMWHGPAGCAILLCVMLFTYFAGLGIHKYGVPFKRLTPVLGLITVCLLYVYHLTGAYYPVGFSFYMLVAAGYLIDISMGRTEPVRDILSLSCALSFFPVIVSGPIEKLQDLASRIGCLSGHPEDSSYSFNTPDKRRGFLLILWGLLEKISIADISGLIVGSVFDNYTAHTWPAVIIATVLFAFQLYADFDGYSNIAFGVAAILGIRVSVNFRSPYMSGSVREFWHRWHISLSEWLRDYIYIPLGGSRRGRTRKYLNILITFVASGLWHGIGLNFIVWGALHGVYQILEDIIGRSYKFKSRLLTFIAVDFAWFFFRAGSMADAAWMLGLFGQGADIAHFWNGFAGCGIEAFHIIYLAAAFVLLIVTDIMRFSGRDLYAVYARIPTAVRWMIVYAVIFWILVAWLSLSKTDMSGFIYGNF